MTIVIPDNILHTTRLTEDEIKRELAVLLFQKDKLTLGQASILAGENRLLFQHLLASRKIPVHYDMAEFDQDVKILEETA